MILDPFSGSGTTAAVASKNNRRWIGIDANSEYCELATARLVQEKAENKKAEAGEANND